MQFVAATTDCAPAAAEVVILLSPDAPPVLPLRVENLAAA
jgi:hypothetical protein